MTQQITAKELIEKMAKEIGRLQKLCKDNGINYNPSGAVASIGVTASVRVFDSAEKAQEAMNSQK